MHTAIFATNDNFHTHFFFKIGLGVKHFLLYVTGVKIIMFSPFHLIDFQA